jgi:hypothetical protein
MDLSKQNFHESDRLVGPSNYPIWAFKVEQSFCNYNVWDIVCPEPNTDISESYVTISKDSEVSPSSTSSDKGKSTSSTSSDKGKGTSEDTTVQTISTVKSTSHADKLEKCLCIYSYTISVNSLLLLSEWVCLKTQQKPGNA